MLSNLTEYEVLALGSPVNLADGHARQPLTPTQQRIVASFPSLFDEAFSTPFAELEAAAHAAFLGALGQVSAPIGTGRIVSTYASSVAIDIVARCVAQRHGVVGLIHPTFDNIPALLRSRGLSLVPVEELELRAGDVRCLSQIGALFVTTPNNPTGAVLSASALDSLAAACARQRVTLIVDASFRGFDARARFDTYDVLDRSGAEWIVIEDTGKLWPVLELKLGFIVASEGMSRAISSALSDLLLSVSPVVLAVVRELAYDAARGGLEAMADLIARNRLTLAQSLEGAGEVTLADPGARVSVQRIWLPERLPANEAWRRLQDVGVDVLPGDMFSWARPSEGSRFLRVALARDPDLVAIGADRIAARLAHHNDVRSATS